MFVFVGQKGSARAGEWQFLTSETLIYWSKIWGVDATFMPPESEVVRFAPKQSYDDHGFARLDQFLSGFFTPAIFDEMDILPEPEGKLHMAWWAPNVNWFENSMNDLPQLNDWTDRLRGRFQVGWDIVGWEHRNALKAHAFKGSCLGFDWQPDPDDIGTRQLVYALPANIKPGSEEAIRHWDRSFEFFPEAIKLQMPLELHGRHLPAQKPLEFAGSQLLRGAESHPLCELVSLVWTPIRELGRETRLLYSVRRIAAKVSLVRVAEARVQRACSVLTPHSRMLPALHHPFVACIAMKESVW